VKVKEVMSSNPITLSPKDTVKAAATKIAMYRISGCPVVDEGGKVLGVLTELDILEALKTQYKQLRMLMPPEISFGISFVEVIRERGAMEAFKEIGATKVEDIMVKEVVRVDPEDSVEKAIQLMVKHKIHRILVLQENKLVGVVTRGDILRGFFRTAKTAAL